MDGGVGGPAHGPEAGGRGTPTTPTVGAIARRLGPAGVLAVIAAVVPPLCSIVLFARMNTIGTWLRGHGTEGMVAYAAGFAVLAGLAILPTYASAILGGWAFGFGPGLLAALAGFAGASVIGYLIARRASGDRVTGLIDERPAWRAVRQALIGGGGLKTFGIVTLVRLPVNSPFALTNLLLASTRVGIVPYVAGTVVGMLPRTAAVVYIAAQARALMADEVAGQKKPVWLLVAGGVAFVAAAVVIGVIGKRAVARVTGGPATAGVTGVTGVTGEAPTSRTTP